MLRELSVSMGGSSSSSSLMQVPSVTNGPSGGKTLPRDGGDEDEVTFEVKQEGLSGMCTCACVCAHAYM